MKNRSSIIALVVCAGLAACAFGSPPPPTPQPQPITPEQRAALEHILKLPPGTKVDFEIVNSDGGSTTIKNTGSAVGAGGNTKGGNLSEKIDGSAPSVSGAGNTATGGDIKKATVAEAPQMPIEAWKNPLFWIGIAGFLACGLIFYFRVPKGMTVIPYIAGASLACLAIAFYPILLIWAIGAGALLLGGPLILKAIQSGKLEQDAVKFKEALRAVTAGVDDPTLADDVKNAVKDRIKSQADARDIETIQAVKMEDKIGKFA